MIEHKIIPYNNTEKIIYTLIVQEPLTELSVIANLWEDLDYFIEWLEELINREVPDFSEEGGILDQGILWGSNRSRIIEYKENSCFTEKAEFKTIDLLQLCKKWKDINIG